MALSVKKFGGTSVADIARIRLCAERVAQAKRCGEDVVVVVSAMGQMTDELIALARRVHDQPPARELDVLLATGEMVSAALMAMTLSSMGIQAAALCGETIGLRTDGAYGNARIYAIDAASIRRRLSAGEVAVVAGFQGTGRDGELTTLGRGGSDTTAVALAAALGIGAGSAGACEIYTDVEGVFTADPRHVAEARLLPRVSYEEMSELASLGAGVLHTRAVLLGQRWEVPIHVRHSALQSEGTMVVRETVDMERRAVVGCALTPDLARVSVRGVSNRPGTQGIIFRRLADARLLVDDIIQNEAGDRADVTFTVTADRLGDVKIAAEAAAQEAGGGTVEVEVGLAKVSAVGVGMRTHTGVAAAMFEAIAAAGIRIANITTSEIKISCIVPKEHGPAALRAVHEAFQLGSTSAVDAELLGAPI